MVEKVEAKFEEMATRNPIVTDITRVAQRTGGRSSKATGRMKILKRDSLVRFPLKMRRLWM